MSNNTVQPQPRGISFTGALTIAFVVLKLTHVIAWSWWWVLAPLWIGFLLSVVIITVAMIVAGSKQ